MKTVGLEIKALPQRHRDHRDLFIFSHACEDRRPVIFAVQQSYKLWVPKQSLGIRINFATSRLCVEKQTFIIGYLAASLGLDINLFFNM